MVLVAVLTLFSGCASFSPYSVSEGTIESYLQDAVADFDRHQLQTGSPLGLSLSQADITMGPDGRDVAVIGAGGAARAIGFGLTSAGASLTILNRTQATGEHLAADLQAEFLPVDAVDGPIE